MAYDYHNGFSLGGVTSSSLGLILIDKEIPFMPEIEEQSEEMPGLDGGYDFGIRYKPKIIPVTVRLLDSSSKFIYNTRLRNIASAFNPRLGSKALIFDDENDKQYFARLNETFSPKRLGLISDEFTLSFICYDPFTYSVAEKDLANATSVTANNAGSHLGKPKLIITKTAGAGVLRNTRPDGTTEEITFLSSAPAGVYTIDSKEQTTLLSGAGAYQYIDEERYFSLLGGNNVITKVSGSITNIRVVYRDTWL
jgi:predicted phage tail component-like protein